jgi:uncharacterized membrane protein YcaP (DUF421 family)
VGDALMDVVVRAALVFLILGIVIRITGKRQIAQLSAFDLILLVTMGDLIGQTVLQEDYSLTAGFLAVSTFGVLSMAMGMAMYFLPKSRPVLRGQATVFLRDGKVDEDVMRYEMIHMADLREAAREAGIRHLDEVELAIMETDGTFSFFKKEAGGDDDKQSSERGAGKVK